MEKSLRCAEVCKDFPQAGLKLWKSNVPASHPVHYTIQCVCVCTHTCIHVCLATIVAILVRIDLDIYVLQWEGTVSVSVFMETSIPDLWI